MSDNASCIAHATIPRGVDVSITPENQSSLPGESLEYTVTVKNLGISVDTYTLENIDTLGWGLSISEDLIEVENGMSENVTLTVTIPDNAIGSTNDNITVTATLTENVEVTGSDSCIAHAEIDIDVEVSIEHRYQENENGGTLTYTVTVANTGNVPDTYTLENTDTLGWPLLSLENPSLEVPKNENKTTTLTVIIPDDAIGGTEDTVTVTATSNENMEVSDSDNCIAHVRPLRGVKVNISPDNLSHVPGAPLTYTVTVTNMGVENDNYDLTVSDNAGWGPSISENLLEVENGMSENVTLSVTIPENAVPYTEDNITVIATSLTDNAVSDNASCIAHSKFLEATFYPIDDAEVLENKPDNNYGTNDYMYIGFEENAKRVFLKFKLKNIPAGATIEGAELSLWVAGVEEGGEKVQVHRVDNDDWDEHTITWNNKPSIGDFLDNRNCSARLLWYRWDVTSFVTSQWENENDRVTSFCMFGARENNPPTHYAKLFSKEKAEKDLWPSLKVFYRTSANSFSVSILPPENSALRGRTLNYTVMVKNVGWANNTYNLENRDDAGWTLALSENRFENVSPGENRTATLTVTIPDTASPGTRDNVTVTATLMENTDIRGSASCVAHLTAPAVGVSITPKYQSGVPGWTLTYEVMVKNGGLENDNYSLGVIDKRWWRLTLDNNLFENVPPGENRTTSLRVTIPAGPPPCTEDEITVTATSLADNTVKNSASCIAHLGFAAVGVSITPENQSGLPGATLDYTVTLTNAGSFEDTYDLTVSDNENWGPTFTETATFDSTKSDGYIYKISSSYSNAHDNTTGVVEDNMDNICIGQKFKENGYAIWRGFVFFDTSSLPDDAIITAATLSLYGYSDISDNDFDIVVQIGENYDAENIYPHDPLEGGDYYCNHYSDNGGGFNTDGFSITGYNDIALNEAGINWIRNDRVTKLCLRSSRDIYNSQPTENENEFIYVYSSDKGSGYQPKLTVDYLSRSTLLKISPNDENSATISVDIPKNAPICTRDNLIVTVTSRADNTVENTASCIAHSGFVDFDVSIIPENQSGEADYNIFEAFDLKYTVTVINTGTITDTYILTVNDNAGWGLLLSDNTLEVPGGENKTTTLYVEIPTVGVPLSSSDITVTATSQTDNTVSDNASCIARVAIVDFEIALLPSYQSTLLGENLFYTLTVMNTSTGAIPKIYHWSVKDTENWTLPENVYQTAVPAGESNNAYFTVGVPDNATHCTRDNLTVEVKTFSYHIGTWVTKETSVIAHATTLKHEVIILPLPPSLKRGRPGDNVDFPVWVRNLGLENDTYDLTVVDDALPSWNWRFDDNPLENVENGESRSTTLRVTIPDSAPPGMKDNLMVIATSRKDPTISESKNCIVLVENIIPGVEVSISPSYQSGPPGTSLTYTVTVTNTGDVLDTYELTTGDDAGWSPTVSPSSINLSPGASGNVTLTIGIPETAESSTHDNIWVIAHSLIDDAVEDSASCTAHAIENRGVEVSISPPDDSAEPGRTLTFTVTVKNTGSVLDNYILTVSDDAGWGATLAQSLLTIPADESRTTTVSVTVPSDAAEDELTQINVVATSQAAPTVSDSVTFSATAKELVTGIPLVPLAISAFLIGAAIIVPTYLLRVRPRKAVRPTLFRERRRLGVISAMANLLRGRRKKARRRVFSFSA